MTKAAKEKLYDPEVWRLADYFLAGSLVDEPRSAGQVATDKQSLAVAIGEAVEDWFAANPVEGERR